MGERGRSWRVRGGMGVNERVLWGMQAMCVERGLLEVV